MGPTDCGFSCGSERRAAARRNQLKANTTLSFQFNDEEEDSEDEEEEEEREGGGTRNDGGVKLCSRESCLALGDILWKSSMEFTSSIAREFH